MDFHVHRRLVIVVSTILSLILVVLCAALVYKYIRVAPMRGGNSGQFSSFGRDHIPLGANDVSDIASWMTFDYINHVFALPPDYLKTAIGITDPRYPELSLSRDARENNISAAAFTAQIQTAVADYFTQSAAQ